MLTKDFSVYHQMLFVHLFIQTFPGVSSIRFDKDKSSQDQIIAWAKAGLIKIGKMDQI